MCDRDAKQIIDARGIEIRSRATSFRTVQHEKIDIVDPLTELTVMREKSIVNAAERTLKSKEVPLEQLLNKALADSEKTSSSGKTGDGVTVRPGQPMRQKVIHENDFEHGFTVKREESSSNGRGPLGFWRKKIPETLLDLVIPDQELWKAMAANREPSTVANSNAAILTFLAWVVWKFFFYLDKYGSQGITEARAMLPPWRGRVLYIFGSDLLAIHGYALSTVKNTIIAVRDWWFLYAEKLVKVANLGEMAAWSKLMENASRRLQKTGKKYDATKAKPLFNIVEKWTELTPHEKILTNVWAQLGCRWDTLSMIRKSHFAILPVNIFHNLDIPMTRCGKSFYNYTERVLSVNEAVCCFVEKEKVDSHESRWIPFECNCVEAADLNTRKPGAGIREGKYIPFKPEATTNSDFCLYHGKYGFGALAEKDMRFPPSKAFAARTVKKLGTTLHGPRRNAALWMAIKLFREQQFGSVDVFLRDMAWGCVAQMCGYAAKTEVLLWEVYDLYPLHGKLVTTRRAPSRFKPGVCEGKLDWSEVNDTATLEVVDQKRQKLAQKLKEQANEKVEVKPKSQPQAAPANQVKKSQKKTKKPKAKAQKAALVDLDMSDISSEDSDASWDSEYAGSDDERDYRVTFR